MQIYSTVYTLCQNKGIVVLDSRMEANFEYCVSENKTFNQQLDCIRDSLLFSLRGSMSDI